MEGEILGKEKRILKSHHARGASANRTKFREKELTPKLSFNSLHQPEGVPKISEEGEEEKRKSEQNHYLKKGLSKESRGRQKIRQISLKGISSTERGEEKVGEASLKRGQPQKRERRN